MPTINQLVRQSRRDVEKKEKAAGIAKGSSIPQKDKVGRLTREQVREIALTKQPDLNSNDIEAAMKIVEGTARSIGVTIRP